MVVRQLARACTCRGAERTTATEVLDAAGRYDVTSPPCWRLDRSSSCAHCCWSIHASLPPRSAVPSAQVATRNPDL
ncbi:hypothetical protein GQ55_6G236400 [Panicum hallii var. hallii]|uniref:Uncharacterized protein n=1 Tax=Panicum hallii var. hallii TaxID=1504633 RepID=A0A2T7D8S5_9POAL|nr:hypothetical protein GQ55_6G236400 [Panicum hallii var. hallii]